MLQAALAVLARLLVEEGDLLKARMKITTYNHHARLLSSRAFWSFIRNQSTRSEGSRRCHVISLLTGYTGGFLAARWDVWGLEARTTAALESGATKSAIY